MPRIYDGYSDPYDFCTRHFPNEANARKRYGNGTGPDDRGNCFEYNAEHPDYDGEDYRCHSCRCRLTGRDN